MSVQTLQQIAEQRRSLYVLNKELPLEKDAVVQMIEHALKHTPSSFNSQTTRVLALFGAEHETLWDLVAAQWRKIIPENQFEATENKLNMFKAAAGSILFFEDKQSIVNLQTQFPAYGAHFPVWAEHSNAMTQYAIWNTLTAAGVGANLQHHHTVINELVLKTWDVPTHWHLRAQLVFGGIAVPAGEKTFMPMAERLKVAG